MTSQASLQEQAAQMIDLAACAIATEAVALFVDSCDRRRMADHIDNRAMLYAAGLREHGMDPMDADGCAERLTAGVAWLLDLSDAQSVDDVARQAARRASFLAALTGDNRLAGLLAFYAGVEAAHRLLGSEQHLDRYGAQVEAAISMVLDSHAGSA